MLYENIYSDSMAEIQEYMDLKGFRDNSYLINDEKGMNDFGSSAYFVNKEWLENLSKVRIMKAYTDLEQSKRLAKILPIESADMCYRACREKDGTLDYLATLCLYQFASWVGVPCWSLAALLEVLPTIDDGNRNPVVCKDIRLNKWHVVYYGTAVEPTIDSDAYDNPVNACYEMVTKLYEEKLL